MKRIVVLALLLLAFGGVANAQVKVVIDPGHGGNDPGGTGNAMEEKILVLDVSKRFKALLEADTADAGGGGSWTAFLTRSDDTFVSLAGRSAYSNSREADRFMSIHSNAFGDATANGTETFSLANGTTGAALRNLVQEEMITAWGLTNRGNKTANFAVLRDTAAPAVLHELAFITNTRDAAKLASADERQKAAVAHLRAIQRHYNIAPYVPSGGGGGGGETGTIVGHVFNSAKGAVVGATLAIDGLGTVTSDNEGAFMFANVPVGKQTVYVNAAGYQAYGAAVDVIAGQTVTAEIEIYLVGDGEPPPGGGGEPTQVGGCVVGGGASWLVAVALVSLRRRRRARAA